MAGRRLTDGPRADGFFFPGPKGGVGISVGRTCCADGAGLGAWLVVTLALTLSTAVAVDVGADTVSAGNGCGKKLSQVCAGWDKGTESACTSCVKAHIAALGPECDEKEASNYSDPSSCDVERRQVLGLRLWRVRYHTKKAAWCETCRIQKIKVVPPPPSLSLSLSLSL